MAAKVWVKPCPEIIDLDWEFSDSLHKPTEGIMPY
jgi:hypothetical protein